MIRGLVVLQVCILSKSTSSSLQWRQKQNLGRYESAYILPFENIDVLSKLRLSWWCRVASVIASPNALQCSSITFGCTSLQTSNWFLRFRDPPYFPILALGKQHPVSRVRWSNMGLLWFWQNKYQCAKYQVLAWQEGWDTKVGIVPKKTFVCFNCNFHAPPCTRYLPK